MSKDLFDLFRENQDKLNQKPSPAAWSRIERRIQSPKTMGKRRNLRTRSTPMGIAAALALVIGLMVAFIWILGQEKEQRAFAMAQAAYEVEDLVITPTQNEQQTVRTQIKKSSKPINEGHPEQKLVAKIGKHTPSRNSSTSSMDSVKNERLGR